MAWSHDRSELLVCNSNADTVSRIDLANKKVSEINVKPDLNLPFGSMPNAVHSLGEKDDSERILVALAGNNALNVMKSNQSEGAASIGLVPTGWYPSAITSTSDYIFVANVKGVGSRADRRDETKGKNSHDHLGSVQRIPRSLIDDTDQLTESTAEVEVMAEDRPLETRQLHLQIPKPSLIKEVSQTPGR